MTEVLATLVTLVFLATCWVYWREAHFQKASGAVLDRAQKAAITSTYIAIAEATACWSFRLYFILSGIPQVLELGRVADTSQIVMALALALLIAGGNQLIERAARGLSLFAVDRRLQLNNASFSLFAADTAKTLLVSAAFGLPLVAGGIWLMEAGNAHWWLSAWAIWFGILTLRMLVKPHIETILFSAAHDLPDGDLRTRLEGLMKRCGIGANSLRVIEASKRTRRVNASVTGLGAHKQILLFDTLVERLSTSELEAVLAHEAGHVRHQHLGKAWAGLGLLGLASAYVTAAGMDLAELAPAQVTGLMLAAYPSALMCLRPLLVSITRRFEFQADAFAAMHCGAAAMEDALGKIFSANCGVWEHHWAYAAVFAGHPSGRERILQLQQTRPGLETG